MVIVLEKKKKVLKCLTTLFYPQMSSSLNLRALRSDGAVQQVTPSLKLTKCSEPDTEEVAGRLSQWVE